MGVPAMVFLSNALRPYPRSTIAGVGVRCRRWTAPYSRGSLWVPAGSTPHRAVTKGSGPTLGPRFPRIDLHATLAGSVYHIDMRNSIATRARRRGFSLIELL